MFRSLLCAFCPRPRLVGLRLRRGLSRLRLGWQLCSSSLVLRTSCGPVFFFFPLTDLSCVCVCVCVCVCECVFVCLFVCMCVCGGEEDKMCKALPEVSWSRLGSNPKSRDVHVQLPRKRCRRLVACVNAVCYQRSWNAGPQPSLKCRDAFDSASRISLWRRYLLRFANGDEADRFDPMITATS